MSALPTGAAVDHPHQNHSEAGTRRSDDFRYALAARAGHLPPALWARLLQRWPTPPSGPRSVQGTVGDLPEETDSGSTSLLRPLLDRLTSHAGSPAVPGVSGSPTPLPFLRSTAQPDLKSISYLGPTLARLSTEQQLNAALAQVPANAGPMNSQHLVLQAFSELRAIAPDYLAGLITYLDTLLWLEQQSPVRAPAREGRSTARARK